MKIEAFFQSIGFQWAGNDLIKDSIKISKDSEGKYKITKGNTVLYHKPINDLDRASEISKMLSL